VQEATLVPVVLQPQEVAVLEQEQAVLEQEQALVKGVPPA
jgi:hypothetical protein